MRRFLALTEAALVVVGLAAPSVAFSSAGGTIDVRDSVAGLSLAIDLYGFEPGADMSLVVRPPYGEDVIVPVRVDARGGAMATLRAEEMEIAGRYEAFAERKGAVGARAVFEVFPDSFDARSSLIQVRTFAIEPNGRDETIVTVAARDRFGNPLPGRPMSLVAGRSRDRVDALDQETDSRGEQRFAVSTTQPGTIGLRAVDLLSGTPLDAAASIEAGSAVGGDRYAYESNYAYDSYYDPYSYTAQLADTRLIDRFEIVAPDTMTAGVEAQQITIRAVDGAGNVVERYTNTVRFSAPDDPLAVLPGLNRTYKFEGRDRGQRTFALSLRFGTPGPQTLRVEDIADPSIKGEKVIQVTGGSSSAGSQKIVITSHKDGETVGSEKIVLKGKGPAFVNLTVTGGIDDRRGDTNRDGEFEIPVELNPAQRDFTLRVRDESGRHDSGNLHLILDNAGPEIESVTFNPERPSEGTQTVAVVKSEGGLSSVTMQITDPKTNAKQEFTLVPNEAAGSGTYQGIFTAPAAGAYQPLVKAVDAAGNATELRTTLAVGAVGLPTVQKLRADSRARAVELKWDAVAENVDQYRIYVGEDEDDFAYTLETGKVTTKATIAGLVPGKVYYFAVTALKDELESREKSNVVSGQALGLGLTATEGDGWINAQWTLLPRELNVVGYRLDFGVDPKRFQSQVLLPRDDDSHVLTDLINGVAYYIRVTPVALSGASLADLAETVKAVPDGDGFRAAPYDPYDRPTVTVEDDPLPDEPFHGGAPSQPATGLPEWIWWLAGSAALLVGYVQWSHRRSQRVTEAFLRAMQDQYHDGR